jgi:hypothetical protein
MRRPVQVDGQQPAFWVDLRALAGHSDRARVRSGSWDGFANPAEPGEDPLGVLGDLVLESVLVQGLDEMALRGFRGPEVGVRDVMCRSPELDVRDDVRQWWRIERRGPGRGDVSPDVVCESGDQRVSGREVRTEVSGGCQAYGQAGEPGEWVVEQRVPRQSGSRVTVSRSGPRAPG